MSRYRFRRADGVGLTVPRDVWLSALDLAVRRGWKPRGVDVPPTGDRMEHELAYFPPRGQRVSEEDAREIGQALELALTFVSDRLVSRQAGAFGERNTLELIQQAARDGHIQREKTEAALEVLSGPLKPEAARLAKFLARGGFAIHARYSEDGRLRSA